MQFPNGSLPGGCFFFISAKAAPTLSTCIFCQSLMLVGRKSATKSRTTIPPEKRKLIFLRHRCITGYKGAVGYYLRKTEMDRYRRRCPYDNKPTYGAENMENTKNQNTGYPGIGTKSVKAQSPAKNGNHFRNRNPVPMDSHRYGIFIGPPPGGRTGTGLPRRRTGL